MPRSHRSTRRTHAAGWLTLGTTAAGGLNYVYSIGLTHALSRPAYAVFAGGQSLLLIKGVVGTGGVPWVLAREIAGGEGDAGEVRRSVNFAFWMNVWTGAALALLLGGIALAFSSAADSLVVAATVLVLSVASTGQGYLQGYGRTAHLAVINTIEVVLKLGIGLMLVSVAHLGAVGALLGPLAGAFVPLSTLPLYARSVGRPATLRLRSPLMRAAGRISALQVGVGVLSGADSVLSAVLASTGAAAAPYQAAATVGRVPLYVSNAVSTAVFPTLRQAGRAQRQAAAFRSYLAVSGFFALCLVTVPRTLVYHLFPSTFHSVATWLPYTAALGLLLGMLNLAVTGLQSEERVPHAIVALTAAVAASLVAMAVGGLLGGIRGLAVAAVVSVGTTAVIATAQPSERPSAAILLRDLGSRRAAFAAAAVLLLAVASPPALWLAAVIVLGALTLSLAFPELNPVPSLRARSQRRSGRAGSGS